jgi:hypothetical protein
VKLPHPFAILQQQRLYFKQQKQFFFLSDIIARAVEQQSMYFHFISPSCWMLISSKQDLSFNHSQMLIDNALLALSVLMSQTNNIDLSTEMVTNV